MLRVDLERRIVVASVRDLAFPAGGMPQSAGRLGGLRAELGAAVHRAYARERAATTPGFRAEVPLESEHRVDDVTLRLRGRVDGLIESADAACVEEVKSVDAPGSELASLLPADVPAAVRQVRLYALMLRLLRPSVGAITARVVLVSLLDGTERVLDVPFSHDEVERELAELVGIRVAEAERRAVRARERAALAGRLRFPFPDVRPQQEDLMQAVREGLAARTPVLAEAPTGVGKTIASLLPALRHALETDAVVFYLTAKRTQRERVAETFRDVAAAAGLPPGKLRALTLRPRRGMCPPETFDCDVERCTLLAAIHDEARRSAAVEDVLRHRTHVTPDDVFATGVRAGVCPHVLSRVLCAHVDVVIGDYNHIYASGGDPGAFPGALLPRPVVAIVDEAHNLPDRAREYDSVFLDRDRVDELARAGPAAARVGSAALEVIDAACRRAAESGGRARDGRRAADLDAGDWDELARQAQPALLAHLRGATARTGPPHDDPVVATLDAIVRLRDLLARDEPQLVEFAAESSPGPAGVGVCCVDPAVRLARRHRDLAGVVLMSATLSPLAHARRALGLDDQEHHEVALPSPFPASARRVVVVPTVDTTWRGRRAALPRIARAIEGVVSARPGHYVAFFPSHRLLADARAHLRVEPSEVIVQESRSTDAERAAIVERLRADPGPVLLLAVTGGVFAEGIDLPGDALVGAIVVGPSLPGIGFERDAMRRYHDERGEDGFAHALLHPGLQRVVQAGGRVHRSAEDLGVIVLLGRRFVRRDVLDCLPRHWRDVDSLVVTPDPGSAAREFWHSAQPAALSGSGACRGAAQNE